MFFVYDFRMLDSGDEMESKHLTASEDAVLFPDELDIVDVVGEKFQVDNWFSYMAEQLERNERRLSPSLTKIRDLRLLER